VLTQFINTGVYNRNRQFFTTASPSMDILISSNLERLLYETSGKDGGAVSGYMSELSSCGRYVVPPSVQEEIVRIFACGMCSEEDTLKTIADMYGKHNYLIDTHTAVAYKVLNDYREKSGDNTPAVVVSTASPYKFCDSVLKALGRPCGEGGAGLIDALAEATGSKIPAPLEALKDKKPRFSGSVQTGGMRAAVLEFLGVAGS